MAHLYLRNLCFPSDERCVTLQPTTREPSDISCVNYALRHYSIDSYKIYLHTHSFSYAELIFPFKTCLPIILFRFLETRVYWNQRFYAMNVPLTFLILFAKVKHFSINEKAFFSCQIHRHSKTVHCCAS